jgi:hypothetical protein
MNQETVTEEKVRPLADVVTAILTQQGHPNPEGWKQFLVGNDENPLLEEALVRRALMNVLVDAAVNSAPPLITIDERMAVMTSTDRISWIRIFTLRVAPCLVKNNLPSTRQ